MALTLARGEDGESKLPAPDPKLQAADEEKIRQRFKEVFSRHEPAAMVSLAEKLIQLGEETKDYGIEQFVLYREGRDLAAEAGDARVAMRAVDAMEKRYAIDALEMKMAALGVVARSCRTPQAMLELGEEYLRLTQSALAAERFSTATRLVQQASALGRKSGGKELTDDAQVAGNDVTYLEHEYGLMRKAQKTLLTNQEDPRANFAVARYLCMAKADLRGAMTNLARGSEAELSAAARKEIEKPATAEERAVLGDLWWSLVTADHALSRERGKVPHRWLFLAWEFRSRALDWYNLALPELSGLRKVEVGERVDKLAKPAETELVGLAGEKQRFRELAPKKGILVGLRLSTDAGDNVIRSLQAIFQTPEGKVYGKRIGREKRNIAEAVAKPGYAVGALTVKGRDDRDGVNGFRIIFMRLDGFRLDPSDSYETTWFGGRRGGSETKLGGDGSLVVGIHGKESDNLDAIGLLLQP